MKFSLWTFSVYFSISADGVWERAIDRCRVAFAFVNKIVDGLWALARSLPLFISLSLHIFRTLTFAFNLSFFLATMEIHLLSYIIYWFACVFAIMLFVSVRACKMRVYMYIRLYVYLHLLFMRLCAGVFARCSSYLMLARLLACVHVCVWASERAARALTTWYQCVYLHLWWTISGLWEHCKYAA